MQKLETSLAHTPIVGIVKWCVALHGVGPGKALGFGLLQRWLQPIQYSTPDRGVSSNTYTTPSIELDFDSLRVHQQIAYGIMNYVNYVKCYLLQTT